MRNWRIGTTDALLPVGSHYAVVVSSNVVPRFFVFLAHHMEATELLLRKTHILLYVPLNKYPLISGWGPRSHAQWGPKTLIKTQKKGL